MKTIKRQTNKKLTITTIILVSIIATYVVLALVFSWWPFATTPADNMTNQTDSAIVDEDTDTSKEPIQPNELLNNSDESSTPTAKKEAHVIVAFSDVVDGNIEVRAATTSEIKGDATCTAIATNDSERVTASSKSFIDATTSQCHPIYIPVSSIKDKSGDWKVSVKYESSEYSGESQSYEVKLNGN